jgi:hypothetical protein
MFWLVALLLPLINCAAVEPAWIPTRDDYRAQLAQDALDDCWAPIHRAITAHRLEANVSYFFHLPCGETERAIVARRLVERGWEARLSEIRVECVHQPDAHVFIACAHSYEPIAVRTHHPDPDARPGAPPGTHCRCTEDGEPICSHARIDVVTIRT